jgi:hypothetical protein
MMSHLCLLPAPHLTLLTLLHRYQWSSDSIFQFFLKSFVEPLVISHLNASPLSAHLDVFRRLVMHLSGNVFASSIGALFDTESIFEIPNAFSDFSEDGLAFVTTPIDIAVLLDVVKDCVELPRLLKMLQMPRYLSTAQEYAPVWIKVFPKNPPAGLYSAMWRNVVFPHVARQVEVADWDIPRFERRYRQIEQIAQEGATNAVFLLEQAPTSRESQMIRDFADDVAVCETPIRFYDFALNKCLKDLKERAAAFERLLVHRFALQRLHGWHELIESDLRIATFSASQQSMIAGMRRRSGSDPALILAQIGSLFDDSRARQVSIAMRVEILLMAFVKDNAGKFQALRDGWRLAIEENLDDRALPPLLKRASMTRALKTIMAMRNILATVHIVPFYRRFFRILEVLRTLDFIERSLALPESSLVRYAVSLSDTDDPDNAFLATVLSISALLVHTVDFVLELGKESEHLWSRFVDVVIAIVNKHEETKRLYHALNEEMQLLL